MGTLQVSIHDMVPDEAVTFVVIVCRYRGKWMFAKHKERDTFEIPGGHRETGETLYQTACRELCEETGAILYEIMPICYYSVLGKTRVTPTGARSFGQLFFADISQLGTIRSEIERVELFDGLPQNLTYPQIQPVLFEEATKYIDQKEKHCL